MEKCTDISDGEDEVQEIVWFGCHICSIRYFPNTESLIKHKVVHHSSIPRKYTRSSVAKIKDCFNLSSNRSKKVDLKDVIEKQRKQSRKPYSKKVKEKENKTDDVKNITILPNLKVTSSASSKSKGRKRNSKIKFRQDVKTEIKQEVVEDLQGESPILLDVQEDSFSRQEPLSSCSSKSVHRANEDEGCYIIEDEEVIFEKKVFPGMENKKQQETNKTEIICITLCSDDDDDDDNTTIHREKQSPVEFDQLSHTKQNDNTNDTYKLRTRKRKNSSRNNNNNVGCYKLRKRENVNPNQYMNVDSEMSETSEGESTGEIDLKINIDDYISKMEKSFVESV